jgi:hypothetical protein
MDHPKFLWQPEHSRRSTVDPEQLKLAFDLFEGNLTEKLQMTRKLKKDIEWRVWYREPVGT